jgi:hypothetical protein
VTKGLLEVVKRKNEVTPYKNATNTYYLSWVPELKESVEDEGVDIFKQVFTGSSL